MCGGGGGTYVCVLYVNRTIYSVCFWRVRYDPQCIPHYVCFTYVHVMHQLCVYVCMEYAVLVLFE